jgi:hypothetical protein
MTLVARISKSFGILFLLAFATPVVEADTVYLKNGAWIDGVVRVRGEKVVEVEIGSIGKIEIKTEEIYEIEKNSRTGEETIRRMQEGQPVSGIPVRNASGDLVTSPNAEGTPGTPTEGDEAKAPDLAPGDDDLDPELRTRIEQLVEDLQRQKTTYRTRAERQLLSIGTPAVPFLVKVAKNDFDLTRISIFRVLEQVGDDRAIEVSIDALLDSNEYVRDFANRTLERVTGEDFGYDSNASPRWREIGHKKWQRWWVEEKAKNAAANEEHAAANEEHAAANVDANGGTANHKK